MHKTTLFLFFIIINTGSGNSQSDKILSDKFIKNLNSVEFKSLVESGKGIILDVRTPEEIVYGYINNAGIVNYYDKDFVEKINLIPKDIANKYGFTPYPFYIGIFISIVGFILTA